MEKVITKKSFIGGRLVYPGTIVDVDAKGEHMPAHSTPIGQLTVDQLEAVLASKRREAGEPEAQFGGNVADPADQNTGSQDAEMARIRPASPTATQPQQIPPGSVPVGDGYLRPASEGAPAAVETLVPARDPLDRDGDGQPGGSMPADPPGLAGKNKAQLLDIAKAEGVAVDDGATNADIVKAIETKRAG